MNKTFAVEKNHTPHELFGSLFEDVQMLRVFSDSKIFVDAIPKNHPNDILEEYSKIKNHSNRSILKDFVESNFKTPDYNKSILTHKSASVQIHIKELAAVLKNDTKNMAANYGSLIQLPHTYFVPGGRFLETYYWDSYFILLGLNKYDNNHMLENTLSNFSYVLSTYGLIPNGNRTYFLTRSQPPIFALLVDLLAEQKGAVIYTKYLGALQKEYDYWTDKTFATQHVVKMPDGNILNRYWDQANTPRQESFYEDKTLFTLTQNKNTQFFRDIRSAAESGWDFSSRWFADGKNLHSIQTTNVIPIDLNCFLVHLEQVLSKAYYESKNIKLGAYYEKLAFKRIATINKYLWNEKTQWYHDYNIKKNQLNSNMTLAGITPYFFQISPKNKFQKSLSVLKSNFIKAGGMVTTLQVTNHQWDAPNGWAPLQWLTYKALKNYGQDDLAREIAKRWVHLNLKIYNKTGLLMEKYNVVDINREPKDGEYPLQNGFGWTNGVLLKFMEELNL